MRDLSRDDFNALAAPLRVVLPGGEVVPLAVKSTQALPAHALRATQPFSVVLEGPADRPLAQGTFGVEHPSLGRIEIFLVPVARSATAFDYEAVFN
jgi:hypothetical protein